MKEETRHTIPRGFIYHVSVMANPNAAASRAKKPFATRWVDDEVVGGIGKGVLVATAPTPPVTGP